MHLSAIPSSQFAGLISDIFGPDAPGSGGDDTEDVPDVTHDGPDEAIIVELSPEALAYLEGLGGADGDGGGDHPVPVVIDVDITNNIFLPGPDGVDGADGTGEVGHAEHPHHTHRRGHIRKAHLRRIWDKIKVLVKSARRLEKKADILEAVAVDLKAGRTPRSYRRTARVVEKLANARAHKYTTKALNLEHEAEELEDLGGSFNLKRAALKRKAAANLYELADDIRSKAEERADANRHKAAVLDRILDKLGIDWQGMDEEELKNTGQLLEEKAGTLREIADARRQRARRLKRHLRRLIKHWKAVHA